MKITPEQLAALQLQQQKNIARSTSGEGFALALNQEMNLGTPVQSGTAIPTAMPMVGLDQAVQAAMLQTSTEQSVMNKMDSLLSQWENYSQTIGTPHGNLRDGYTQLAAIRENIQEVKGHMAHSPAHETMLQSILEELDILTTTEEFKFNRGDYLN